MRFKKIISISLAIILSFLLLSTTAMGYLVEVNRYNKTYEYTGKGNEMSWLVKGTKEKARTKATNPTSNSRYVSVAVAKYKVSGDVYVSGKDDSNTGKKVYADTSMARNMTNKKIYYYHYTLLKPSASNGYVIDSVNYKVYQKS